MSIFNKFKKIRKTSETGSVGSIHSIGTNNGLLNTAYSINEKDLTPFLKAIWKNDTNKIKKLMKKNYNNVDKEQRSGLHLACAMGNLEIVRELLGNYCNELLEKRDGCGRTGLFKAVECGAMECVQLLREKGANMKIVDGLGDTLIHAAVRHKHAEILQILLDANCDANILNNAGFAPLHLAASENYFIGIDKLISSNVDINLLTNSGKSSLILASECGNHNIIKVLLSRNADINITDNDGKNALYYADFHEYSDCAQQIKSTADFSKNKTPPRRPISLQMPEFIVSNSQSPESMSNSPEKTIILKTSHDEKMTKDKRGPKKRFSEKRETQRSITSENSWSEDFSRYSSDNTLPIGKTNNPHDISTPSSMPNPSEGAFNPNRQVSHAVTRTQLGRQMSDDDESQWTDTEAANEQPLTAHKQIYHESQVSSEPNVVVIESIKNGDSDWDSDTEVGKNDPDGFLSTIDEETGLKQDMRMQISVDGHQTDSNIDECYKTNYNVLNKPVRYQSNEALDNSIDYDDDEDTDLSQTKIRNPNFKEGSLAPFSKPPVSPMTRGERNPVITIEDIGHRRKSAKNIVVDNLSYTSSERSSRQGSQKCYDNDFDGTSGKWTEEYIKKCSSIESRLRTTESERDVLYQDIKRLNDSKTKLEIEHTKIQKDYQKMEVMLSERKDELDEFKSRFIISEELLKTREKELFEARKINQDLVGNRNEIEMKSIASNSKINQLQQEISNLHAELQKSHSSEKESDHHKTTLETERSNWAKNNEDLTNQLSDLRQELSQSRSEYDRMVSENRSSMNDREQEIKNLQRFVEERKEDDTNKDEELEQLKKTIKNLNADLESSNKSSALVAKEEQKNKVLNEQMKKEVETIKVLTNEIMALKKQISETGQSYNNTKSEMERLQSQLVAKESKLSQVDLKFKSSEQKAHDFEKLLEEKVMEVKDANTKCRNLDEDLRTEKRTNEKTLEKLNAAINSAIGQHLNPEEVLGQLKNIRKLVNGSDVHDSPNNQASPPFYQDIDSSIELSKARSQIRVLQEELDRMKRDLTKSKEEMVDSKKELPSHSSHEFEMERVDNIERIEKENQQHVQDQSRLLYKSQQQEKQKLQLIKEKEQSMSIQLNNSLKSNQALLDIQEAIKDVLNKYNKHMELTDNLANSNSSMDYLYMDLPLFCSKLLKQLSDVIDDMKIKLKKLELQKQELEEEQVSRDKNKDVLIGNSKMILTHQLSEITQLMDNQRNNREKLEKIRDENEFQLRNELYQLRQSNLMDVSQLSEVVTRLEKDRDELQDEVRALGNQIVKERELKDSVTEQLLSIMRNPSNSIPQISGIGKDFIFPNYSSSQWTIPTNNGDHDRRPFSTSLSNISIMKNGVTEAEELRQRMRKELDRSIAKHLEEGKPIRQLNVKEKIRSLNIVKYPNNSISWKTQ